MSRRARPERLAAVPARTALFSIGILWLSFFALLSARSALLWTGMEGELLWRRAIVCLVGIAVTLLLWLALRALNRFSLSIKVVTALVLAAPAALVIAHANAFVLQPIEGEIQKRIGEERGLAYRRDEAGNLFLDLPAETISASGGAAQQLPPRSILIAPTPSRTDFWRMIIEMALGSYFLLLAWAAMYLALLAGRQAQAVEQKLAIAEAATRTAQMRSLRYQVNPHFLFNTLNSLSALVMSGRRERAEEMIQNLANFYRQSLTSDPVAQIALEEEFAAQQLYLAIEKVRFPDRLMTHFDCPPALARCEVPGMILQPLIENSIRYAVAETADPVLIEVSAREEDGYLVLRVSDTGQHAGSSGTGGGFGIGLANVRERLTTLFGSEAKIISSATPVGFMTELRMPLT